MRRPTKRGSPSSRWRRPARSGPGPGGSRTATTGRAAPPERQHRTPVFPDRLRRADLGGPMDALIVVPQPERPPSRARSWRRALLLIVVPPSGSAGVWLVGLAGVLSWFAVFVLRVITVVLRWDRGTRGDRAAERRVLVWLLCATARAVSTRVHTCRQGVRAKNCALYHAFAHMKSLSREGKQRDIASLLGHGQGLTSSRKRSGHNGFAPRSSRHPPSLCRRGRRSSRPHRTLPHRQRSTCTFRSRTIWSSSPRDG